VFLAGNENNGLVVEFEMSYLGFLVFFCQINYLLIFCDDRLRSGQELFLTAKFHIISVFRLDIFSLNNLENFQIVFGANLVNPETCMNLHLDCLIQSYFLDTFLSSLIGLERIIRSGNKVNIITEIRLNVNSLVFLGHIFDLLSHH
jgi:hypothetical protein